jgi:hypothetical protein
MTTQENELTSSDNDSEASADQESSADGKASTDSATGEKPDPDEDTKQKAAEMMTAYEHRPTLILPGTGGSVSGTAVNDWLDDDGNPEALGDEDAPAAKADLDQGDSSDKRESSDESQSGERPSIEEQIEKDKEFNQAVIEQSERDEGVSEEEKAQSLREEKSVTR